MDLLQKEKFNHLKIIGVIQGWDLESYRKAAREILKMGYDYVGIGGIARRPTSQLVKIVEVVNKEIDKLPTQRRNQIKIHLVRFCKITFNSFSDEKACCFF
jgi:queuine/archaeosine tRNA-ribosyltransferase